ncbi:MAG: hypothetical protein ACK56F_30590 [bacterium]
MSRRSQRGWCADCLMKSPSGLRRLLTERSSAAAGCLVGDPAR